MSAKRQTIARCTCHSHRYQKWLLEVLFTLGFAHWVDTLRKEGSIPSCHSITLIKKTSEKSPTQYHLQLTMELQDAEEKQ